MTNIHTSVDPIDPPGPASLEVLEDRIWVDGCWDFFHHGTRPDKQGYEGNILTTYQAMLVLCSRLVN